MNGNPAILFIIPGLDGESPARRREETLVAGSGPNLKLREWSSRRPTAWFLAAGESPFQRFMAPIYVQSWEPGRSRSLSQAFHPSSSSFLPPLMVAEDGARNWVYTPNLTPQLPSREARKPILAFRPLSGSPKPVGTRADAFCEAQNPSARGRTHFGEQEMRQRASGRILGSNKLNCRREGGSGEAQVSLASALVRGGEFSGNVIPGPGVWLTTWRCLWADAAARGVQMKPVRTPTAVRCDAWKTVAIVFQARWLLRSQPNPGRNERRHP